MTGGPCNRPSRASSSLRATGSLFTDQDGKRVAPYGGPELHLTDLARTPASAAAFLLAVAAMRRQREAVALGREAAQLERLGPVLDAAPRGFPDRG